MMRIDELEKFLIIFSKLRSASENQKSVEMGSFLLMTHSDIFCLLDLSIEQKVYKLVTIRI